AEKDGWLPPVVVCPDAGADAPGPVNCVQPPDAGYLEPYQLPPGGRLLPDRSVLPARLLHDELRARRRLSGRQRLRRRQAVSVARRVPGTRDLPRAPAW